MYVLFASVNTRSFSTQSNSSTSFILRLLYFLSFCHIFVTQLICTFLDKACDSCLCTCLYKDSVSCLCAWLYSVHSYSVSCLLGLSIRNLSLFSWSCLNRTSVCYSILVFPVRSTILVSTKLVSPVLLSGVQGWCLLSLYLSVQSQCLLSLCLSVQSPCLLSLYLSVQSYRSVYFFVLIFTKPVSPVFVICES